MKIAMIALSATVLAAPASATEIAGKWGLGFSTGTILGSRAEASVLRGVSERSAWLLDISFSESIDDADLVLDSDVPDTLIVQRRVFESWSVNLGPRLRRFTRPASHFSPYWDVFVHFIDFVERSSLPTSASSRIVLGGEVGTAFGVEYFLERWPVSFAAHSGLFTFRVTHQSNKTNDPFRASETSGVSVASSIALSPALQLRVYF